jgi:hypothetical protein
MVRRRGTRRSSPSEKRRRRRLGDNERRGGADGLSGGSLPSGGCGSASETGAGRAARECGDRVRALL